MQGISWPDEETRRQKTADRMRINRKRFYARHYAVAPDLKRENYQRAARRRADLLWGPESVWGKTADQRLQTRELLRLKACYVRAMRRVETRLQGKLARTLRSRFKMATKAKGASGVIRILVGCSMAELKQYLEKQFLPGMTWENHGFYGWHIDHIRPLAKFDLRDPAQQQEAFHFSNLQPLWGKDNFSKGSK